MTGIITGIIVCAFVYVIKETLMSTEEEDYEERKDSIHER